MRRVRPVEPILLTPEGRATLDRWARRPTTAQALAQRARIILACATVPTKGAVADRFGVTRQVVGRWRRRLAVPLLHFHCIAAPPRRRGRPATRPGS